MKRRIISIVLVLALLVQILPTYVFAENDTSETFANQAVEAEPGTPGTMIVGEMTDRRTVDGKHFRMDDGSYIAVDYGAPVHFTTDEGKTWEDIDNTLTLSRDETNIYTSENGDAARSFAADLRSGLLFTASDGDYSLRMGLAPCEISADNYADNAPAENDSTEGENDTDDDNTSLSNEKALSFNHSSVAEISYPDVKTRGMEELSLAEQVTPSKLHTQILYQDVYENVDLQYELYSYNVKETILINQPLDGYSFTFYMDPDDLTPILMDDGSIELRNEVGEAVYQIPAPYMYDADGAESDAVSYDLTKTASGSWALTVTADTDWINDEARVFPVAIDPTVIDVVTWTKQGIAVTHVVQGEPSQSHQNYQMISVGYDNSGPLESRIYIGVDSLPDVPAGSEVVSASLGLGKYDRNGMNPFDHVGVNSISVELHDVTASRPSGYSSNYSWIYTRTWNNKPATSDTVLEYATLSAGDTKRYDWWTMTALIKEWYQECADAEKNSLPLPTMAACLRVTNPGQYGQGHYANARFYGYGTYGPLFIVNYRDMTGIEPYYSYQALGADRAGAAYISDYTGALTTVTPLVSYASTVNPFSLNLIYNSSYFKGETPDNVTVPLNLGYGMRMGSGMTLDLLQKVEYVDLQYEIESSGTKRYIKYTDGDGTAHYFATDSDKQANEPAGSTTYYYDEDGLGLKITEYATNYFRLEDDNGNKSVFVHGFLTYTEDANGNKIQIRFSDSNGNYTSPGYPYSSGYKPHHIEQINNGQSAITVASFEYDSSQTNLLRYVTDASGTVYKFLYSSNRLSAVQRKLVNEADFHPYVKFEYEGFRMTTIKDRINQYSINMSYTEGRVNSYWEQSESEIGAGATIIRIPGEKTTYTDWGNDRTLGNEDDISTTYLFDYAGRTVNAFSTDANGVILGASNAVHTGIGDTDKKNNRTLRSAGIGMAGVSMVRNGGFELSGSSLDWTAVIPDGSTCGATVKTGELVRTGTNAFKTWVNSSATGPTGAKKLIGILPAGETYTASVYVNTSAASIFGDKGIYLRILDAYGSYQTGEYLNYKTDTAIDSGWVKLSFTFTTTHNANHYICIYDEGVRGAVYYDDLQVEAGDAHTNVNLLDNGGITSAAGWLTESNATPTTANITAIQGGMALQIIGNPKTDKYIHQTVSLNQPGTQTYVLSGWAKAIAVPDNVTTASGDTEEEKRAKDTNKQFGLRAILTYSDNTTEYHYVPFNTDVTDWQFASLTIVPKKADETVAGIKVVCAYEKNANTAYFDNLSLVKEVAQTMKYDEDGNLVSVQSSGTKEETSTYDNGNLTQVKTGGSGTFDYTYDNKHNLTDATNGTVKEHYSYDSMGNVSSTALSKASGTPTADQIINSSKEYTNSGNLVSKDTGSNGTYTSNEYASDLSKMLGAATKTTNPKNESTVINYHDDGRVSSSWISSTIAVSNIYDSKTQLTKLDRGGYNTHGNDSNTAYHQFYNFTYDAFGNTTGISVGNTNTYNLGSYTYAPKDGLLTGMTYGNGATVSYSYDDYGRKTQTNTSSGDSYNYSYTGDGQLYEMKDVSGSLLYRYTYDTLGRLIGSSMKSGSTVTLQTQHKYDDANRLSKQVWDLSGETYQESYEYDENNGRLTQKQFTLPGAATPTLYLNYDNLSRLSSVYSPMSITYYNYAAALYGTGTTGLVSQMSVSPRTTGSGVFERLYYKYFYDSLGNITSIQELDPSNTVINTTAYTYDNQSQLTQATSTVNGTWNYQYDTYGNIRHQDHGSDAINYTYGDSDWLDLLTAVSGTKNGNSFSGSYVYDGSGNPTSYYSVGDLSTWTMTWKNGRELATASNGTHTISYDYDVNGLRTYKIVDGVRHDYTYASGQLLRETFTQGGTDYALDFLYDQSGRPYLVNISTTIGGATTTATYYYLLNLQGDVVKLVDASSIPVASYTYDPYGSILTSTGSLAAINPLRYRGYYYDTETGFYYLQSRYYDPTLGRFLNADSYASTGQDFLGYNMFAYCANNPTIRIDNQGSSWSDITDWIKQAFEWIDERAQGTYTNGFEFSINLGPISCNYCLMFSADLHGNIVIQTNTGATGQMSGDITFSAKSFTMVTTAPSVDELDGPAYQGGVSVSAPIPYQNFNGTSSVDYCLIPDKKSNTAYIGKAVSNGISYPANSGGICTPVGYSYTTNQKKWNIFEMVGKLIKRMKE